MAKNQNMHKPRTLLGIAVVLLVSVVLGYVASHSQSYSPLPSGNVLVSGAVVLIMTSVGASFYILRVSRQAPVTTTPFIALSLSFIVMGFLVSYFTRMIIAL